MKLFILIIFLINYSYAIFGIGGYYDINSAKIKSTEGNFALSNGDVATAINGNSSTFSGAGIVIWVDEIPLIDIEISAHVKYMTYSSALRLNNESANVVLEFLHGPTLSLFFPHQTIFGEFNGDASILYPLITVRPEINLLKFYVGGGLSYGIFSRLFDKDFVSDAIANNSNPDLNVITGSTTIKALLNGYTSGYGLHIVGGTKLDVPILPITGFLNLKYRYLLNRDINSGVDLELGAALAF